MWVQSKRKRSQLKKKLPLSIFWNLHSFIINLSVVTTNNIIVGNNKNYFVTTNVDNNSNYERSRIYGEGEANFTDHALYIKPSKKRFRNNRHFKLPKTLSSHAPKPKVSSDKTKVSSSFEKTISSTSNKKNRAVKRFKANPDKFSNANRCAELTTQNLVELYHNTKAVNKSDSDESCQKTKTPERPLQLTSLPLTQVSNSKFDNLTNINIDKFNMSYCPPPSGLQSHQQQQQQPPPENYYRCPLTPIGENDQYDNRSRISSHQIKNYELPTIASKLKQVAKGYIHTFDFRTIPFVAARSTTPSHNIGINIQQVMSIIKTRHSINAISPTLAHNIGLAAERLQNNKPLSAIVSSLGSRLA